MENQEEGIIFANLVHAFEVYQGNNNLKELADSALRIAGFTKPDEALPQKRELLWECALASNKGRLSLRVYVCFASSVIDYGFIPVRLRPTM